MKESGSVASRKTYQNSSMPGRLAMHLPALFALAPAIAAAQPPTPPSPDTPAEQKWPALRQNLTPAEQLVNTAVPVYVELTDEAMFPTVTVRLRYKAFGDARYRVAMLPHLGKGFGLEVPCNVAASGPLRYYLE